jgi:hypothetical protein
MKNQSLFLSAAFFLTLLTSCEVVEGIFRLGFWVGIIVVVLIIAIIAWLIKKVS